MEEGPKLPPIVPPHNFEVEMALIAAVLANNRAFDKISSLTKAEHFSDYRHAEIFSECAKMISEGKQANAATLRLRFEATGILAELGGAEYLARLQANAVTIVNAQHYATILRDLYVRREAIGRGLDLIEAVQKDHEAPADKIIEELMLDLETLREGSAASPIVSLADAMNAAVELSEKAWKRGGGLVGVPTGFADIDRQIGGLEPGQLYILAGRPSMGKSALALWASYHLSRWLVNNALPWDKEQRKNAGVYFASLEMPDVQFGFRLLGPLCGIEPFSMRVGQFKDGEPFTKMAKVQSELHKLPLFIDQTPAQSLVGIRAGARRVKRRQGLGLIVVDHIQLMRASDIARRQGRVQELSEITAGLKELAKELDAPVVALSQLSRQVEQREDKRPLLSDLRDSGTIEQDADAVMFCYRDEYYLRNAEPKQRPDESDIKFNERHQHYTERVLAAQGLAEVIIAKQRSGPVGTVKLHFDEKMAKFSNAAREHEEQRYPYGQDQ